MNLGRGFSIPQEKKIIQNGGVWLPNTPEKPVLQISNYVPAQAQQNPIQSDNWSDLLGFYTGLLTEEDGNGIHQLEQSIQEFAPIQTNNLLPPDSNSTNYLDLNRVEQSPFVDTNNTVNKIQDFAPVEIFGYSTQNARSVAPVVPPQKVDSLSDLFGMKKITYASLENGTRSAGAVDQSTYSNPNSRVASNWTNYVSNESTIEQNRVLHGTPSAGTVDQSAFFDSHSRVESNWRNYISNGAILEQNHVLPGNQDVGYHYRQQISNNGYTVSYNPSSSTAIPFHFEPVTPDKQNQLKHNHLIQVPQLTIDETPAQEKVQEGNYVFSQQSQIIEKNQDESHYTLGASSAAVSNNGGVVNEGIDLNKTPQQKTPKRRKHRPKVVREGKPKKTPQPAATPKTNTPNGNSTGKRKYVRKNKTNTPNSKSPQEVANAEPEVEIVGSTLKSCKRTLNFDLEKNGVETEEVEKNKEGKILFNLNLEAHNNFPPKEGPTPPAVTTTSKDSKLNFIARSLSFRNANNVQQNGGQIRSDQVRQCIANTNEASRTQLLEGSVVDLTNNRGSKREYSRTESFDQMGSRSTGICNNRNLSQLWGNGSEINKKARVENVISGNSSSLSSRITTVEDLQRHYRSSVSDNRGKGVSRDLSEANKVAWYMIRQRTEQMAQRTSHHILQGQSHHSLQGQSSHSPFISRNLSFATQTNPKVNGVSNSPARTPVKKQTDEQTSSKALTVYNVVQQEIKHQKGRGNTPKKFNVPPPELMRNLFSVDYITAQFRKLCLFNTGKEVERNKALVPYGVENAIVPVDQTKKKKARPKVDLDPESTRLWNFLMGKEGLNDSEPMGEDKQKWWEEERKLLKSRADAFIARMHLVQGDRRFSKWKGSVVDSVIGVFLTQNVSDHLSSSAFMSLAAKFPLKSTHKRSQNDSQEVVITFPDEPNIMREPFNIPIPKIPSPMTSSESFEYGAENFMTGQKTSLSRKPEEEIISSQSSSESFIFQASEEIRSSSGSNSEAEDQINGWTFIKDQGHLSNFEQAERIAAFNQFMGSPKVTHPTDTKQPAEAFSKTPNDNVKRTDNTIDRPESSQVHSSESPVRKQKAEKEKTEPFNWDTLRQEVESELGKRVRSNESMDSLDYEALRNADVRVISDTIKERGMNNMLADRIKDFLNRIVRDHGSVDLEWLRDVQPDKVKDYLLSIRGLGLKSVECVRLLTLHNVAFPVDTNVGRIAVRLGWVPLQPLPESVQLHLLELYPVLETIQKYLWPRLCHLDQETLYELHYQMITFGKVFCTKRDPNCNACPMRAECRHFASAFASARHSLPAPEEKRVVPSTAPITPNKSCNVTVEPMPLLHPPKERDIEDLFYDQSESGNKFAKTCQQPIVEEPKSPEPIIERDIEDSFYDDPNEIPVIKLNLEEFTSNLQSFLQENGELPGDMSKALVALRSNIDSIPIPKLKNVNRLRTEHQVYELPDMHPLIKGLDRREPDDPSPYLLAIWTPGETADSVQPPENKCSASEFGGMCDKKTCFTCSSTREAEAQTVRGTILIPCRTAMRGSFPLNGTYFQVNEVFADHESSMNPIDVPRSLLWNLPRRTVFFGTSVSTIFKGLTVEGIQFCFWKGFVCVRGFDQKYRAPRPLSSRLHFAASKMAKQKEQ